MNWETVNLGDLCSVITKGTSPSNIGASFTDKGIKYIRSEMLTSAKYVTGDFLYISKETHEKLKRSQLNIGDILFSMAGVYLGKTAILRAEDIPSNTNQAVALIRIDPNKCNNEYVYYYLNIPDVVKTANTVQSQSAQPNINLKQIGQLKIQLPDLNIQRRIASILSAYDDLIENNQKQIKLLEEAAQRLYKEWFVDMHFPGWENTKIVDGVPDGWEKKTVEGCLEMHIGGGWGKETPIGNNEIAGKVIRGTDINDIKSGNYTDVPLRYHTANDIKKRALNKNDIVFELSNGNINNIGRSLLIDDLILGHCGENTICASFCKLFRPLDRLHSLVLYMEIQDMQSSGRMLPYKKQGSNGINNFAFDDFLNHELLIPDDKSLLSPLENIMQKMSNIQSQFALLTEARDRLLPKLMSGEVEV